MHKNNIIVLLSTFNGEKYLKEQLSSLYAQEDVDISILVRDDGSKDSTCTILDNEQSGGRLSWYKGENKGPALSFWELLQRAPEGSYYSFCDQDDVWDKDKLKTAVDFLSRSKDKPALYFGQTRLVNSNLDEIKSIKISPLLTFEEALIYHFVTGCTMVINNALRKELLKYTPAFMRMHDIWIYLVAQAIDADIAFDTTPHISYRQHGNNAVGQEHTFIDIWNKRFKRIRKHECIRSSLAKELLKGYGNAISKEKRELLSLIANYKTSFTYWIKLLFNKKLKCAPKAINLTSRTAILVKQF